MAMPRLLFDRLTNHDDAPRCRYDEHAGMAEFVAEPGLGHEALASELDQFTRSLGRRPARSDC